MDGTRNTLGPTRSGVTTPNPATPREPSAPARTSATTGTGRIPVDGFVPTTPRAASPAPARASHPALPRPLAPGPSRGGYPADGERLLARLIDRPGVKAFKVTQAQLLAL
ncbi:MAG TPA: hypothetical protein VFH51_20130, partial [Myxococcota bacterium]|nr:hypothetical protein [Myxococcota bacterium]